MAEIQRRQAEAQKLQAEAADETLSEAGDKLNGLIGFTDNFVRWPQ
jgi:hypothetical protein